MLKKWMLKAAVQKGISLLPYRNQINLWFQKNVTKGIELDHEQLNWKLTHAKDHLYFLQKYGAIANAHCLELGTGWYPIVPIALFLHGAKRIDTVDLNAHLSKESLSTCLEQLIQWHAKGQLGLFLPGMEMDRWSKLKQVADQLQEKTVVESLQALNIYALVADARALPLPTNDVDFICSNNTFEHIFPEILAGILPEFIRVLKPGGVMSHFVDLSDHFAHFDQSITIYNFLRFSKKAWSRIDNVIQPQNRWRWSQYKALYQSLQIPITEESVRPGNLDLLRQVPIHADWAEFEEVDLAISHGYLVSRSEA